MLNLSFNDIIEYNSARRVLKWIIAQTSQDEFNFTGDPIKDAYVNGQRSIGLLLKQRLTKEQLRLIDDEEI